MGQPTKTEAIKNFLSKMTHPDLAGLYHAGMEVQVNVAQEGGTRVQEEYMGKKWHGYTNGLETWKPIRIPYKANSDPEFTDSEIRYDLAKYADGIGMTGWDWQNRLSKWVAFDFDAMSGHSDKHAKKLTAEELQEIKDRIKDIPWCSLRRSTSGKGLHLYVHVTPVPTSNHTEHAALARAILGMISSITRYDFSIKVDVCGGNMWVWHRKMIGTDGLSLIKDQDYILEEVPPNWREHIKVASGSRRKSLPGFINEKSDAERFFEELVNKSDRVPLDEDHSKLMDWLRDNKTNSWWDADHWMLVTHTYHLKEAHQTLGLKGLYQTTSEGSDLNTQNVFGFPMRNGAWSFRRYTPGVAEAPTWDQDGKGWTRCYYNRQPDFKTAAKAFGGIENAKGGFWFKHVSEAIKAAKLLGARIEVPIWINSRPTILREHRDGRIMLDIEQQQGDVNQPEPLIGWLCEKKHYTRILDINKADNQDMDMTTLDDQVRHIVSASGDDCGWVIKTPNTVWRAEPLTHVKLYLQSQGLDVGDITGIMGASIAKCWTLVNKPFQDEYPSGREWNRNAVQLKYKPTTDIDSLSYPTWMQILDHCGSGLDNEIKKDPWCQSSGIMKGGDYLKCWIASILQQPLEPLPYLFFYGEQGSGKSIFHESLAQLVTHGVVDAKDALLETYNGQLANAVICYVEEVDLQRNKQAYNKIKDWVTADRISIRAMYEQPYMIPNSTHWCQFANDAKYCPVFPGDTRITYLDVKPLDPGEMIPRKFLFPLLAKEASDFTAALLRLELPISKERLNLPVIMTQDKITAERINRNLLEEFLEDHCHYAQGHTIKFSELCESFHTWIEDPTEKNKWSKKRIGSNLPAKYPHGRVSKENGQFYIGNISLKEETTVLPKLILKDSKLEVET